MVNSHSCAFTTHAIPSSHLLEFYSSSEAQLNCKCLCQAFPSWSLPFSCPDELITSSSVSLEHFKHASSIAPIADLWLLCVCIFFKDMCSSVTEISVIYAYISHIQKRIQLRVQENVCAVNKGAQRAPHLMLVSLTLCNKLNKTGWEEQLCLKEEIPVCLPLKFICSFQMP